MSMSISAIWISGLLIIVLLLSLLRYLRRKSKNQRSPMPQNSMPVPNEPAIVASGTDLDEATLAALGFSKGADWLTVPAAMAAQPAAREPVATIGHPEVIVMHVMARQGQRFFGYDLLQSLLIAGLRFDKKGIFQRYEQTAEGKEEIAFSVVSAVEPGIFDLNKMGAFSCPGITLFMPAEKLEHAGRYFALMVETAKQLAEELDADVCGEDYRPLTEEELGAYRDRLQS